MLALLLKWRDLAYVLLVGAVIAFFIHKGYVLREDLDKRDVAIQVKHNQEIEQNVKQALAKQKAQYDAENLAPISVGAKRVVLIDAQAYDPGPMPCNAGNRTSGSDGNGVRSGLVVVDGESIEEHFRKDAATIKLLRGYIKECQEKGICGKWHWDDPDDAPEPDKSKAPRSL